MEQRLGHRAFHPEGHEGCQSSSVWRVVAIAAFYAMWKMIIQVRHKTGEGRSVWQS